MNRYERKDWSRVVAKLLPGDHIHAVAPSSQPPAVRHTIAALDAAKLKRMRRLIKRARP